MANLSPRLRSGLLLGLLAGVCMAFNAPKAYLFTIVPYGTRLHGDERGTVDEYHGHFGTPLAPGDAALKARRQASLRETPLLINPKMRAVIEDTLAQHCAFRGWRLLEFNVRTNHIHAVVSAAGEADAMLKDLKAYLTRSLRTSGALGDRRKVWAEGGSKRHLFTDDAVRRACSYVRDAQGPDLPRDDA